MANPTEASLGASFFRPIGNSSQTGSLLTQNNSSRHLVSEVKNVYDNDHCRLVEKIICCVLGAGLIAGGLMTLTTSVSYIQVVGGFLTAGGAALLGRAVYLEKASCDAENAKYEELNRKSEALIIRNRLERESARSITKRLNVFERFASKVSDLRQEIDRFAQERQCSSQDIERLDQIAGLLNGGLAEFLENVQRNTQVESSALSAFKTKIEQCNDLINRFEEGSASSIATILNVLERFVSSLLSTQGKLENTKRELSSTLGKLQLLEREFEQTTRRSGQKLQEFETASAKAQDLIDKKDKYEQYLNGQSCLSQDLV